LESSHWADAKSPLKTDCNATLAGAEEGEASAGLQAWVIPQIIISLIAELGKPWTSTLVFAFMVLVNVPLDNGRGIASIYLVFIL
jgi:hypothetical protein